MWASASYMQEMIVATIPLFQCRKALRHGLYGKLPDCFPQVIADHHRYRKKQMSVRTDRIGFLHRPAELSEINFYRQWCSHSHVSRWDVYDKSCDTRVANSKACLLVVLL